MKVVNLIIFPAQLFPLSFCKTLIYQRASFPGGSVVKNLPANVGDLGSTPGLGRPPEKEMATHSSILAWRIPRTEEPGGLQSVGLQRFRHN